MMPSTSHMLAGLALVDDQKLTTSQRNRCMTLFALQDDPFGMMSQVLYSKALERENRQTEIIQNQQLAIASESENRRKLLSQISELRNLLDARDQQISILETGLLGEISRLKLERDIHPSDVPLLDEINELMNTNAILMRSLEMALDEILRLIGNNN